MKGFEAVAQALSRLGVRNIFGLLGEDVAQMMVAARSLGVEYYSVRHENQAVIAADSFARTTGGIGVATLAGGPGFTNAITALNTGHRFGTRAVVIVGGEHVGAKYVPHASVCAALGIACETPEGPEDLVAAVHRAFAEARRNNLVVLDIPVPYFSVDMEFPVPELVERRKDPVIPDGQSIADLAAFLQEEWAVRRPVILAGRGAMYSDGSAVLRELGQQIGALLATTVLAHGAFRGDPFDIGISGTFSSSMAVELMASADCVLAFGASLNRYTTYGATLYPKARVIQIDSSGAAIGLHHQVDDDLSLVGDVRLTAEALVSELRARGHQATGFRSDRVAQQLEAFDPRSDFADQSSPGALDPRTVAARIDASLPEDRLVVLDGAHCAAFAVPYFRIQKPSDFVQTTFASGAGSIGLSTGAAIGAAIGHPGRTVLCWMGDASHMMSVGDIETAARYSLPIVYLVCNDRALGAEVKFLELVGMPPSIAEVGTPDLGDVARSLGAEGHLVESLDDLDKVAARVREPINGPIVVDCRVNPAVRADYVELMWGDHVS